jgi:transcriptional regulator with XRE-family HTH domain
MDGVALCVNAGGMARKSKRPPAPPGHYIQEWRRYRNLTQEGLAGRLESTAATISRIEGGKQNYTQPMLEAIADALQCEPADLLRPPPVDPILAEAAKLLDRIPDDRIEEAVMFLKVLTRAA